jgi:hypothetical protein
MMRPMAASIDENGTTAAAIRTVAHASAGVQRSSAAQQRVLDQLTELPMREAAGVVSTFVSQQLGAVRDEVLAVMLVGLGAQEEVALALPVPSAGAVAGQLEIEHAAKAVVLEHEMLSAEQVAAALRSRSVNRRGRASALRKDSKIVGLEVSGRTLYPAFQFDRARARVYPVVVEGNQVLDAANDPWGAASWWLSSSSWLADGRSPADLVVAGEDATVRELISALVDG